MNPQLREKKLIILNTVKPNLGNSESQQENRVALTTESTTSIPVSPIGDACLTI